MQCTARRMAWSIACVLTIVSAAATHAATSGSVVGATVPSAVLLTNSCTGAPATQFGNVAPGSAVLTDRAGGRCRIGFQSSNDTAMLRVVQSGGTGVAMTGRAGGYTNRVPSPDAAFQYSAVDPATPTTAWMVDWDSNVFKTTNGGAGTTGWNYQSNACSCLPNTLEASAAGSLWLGANAGVIRRSTDGGATWSNLATPPAGLGTSNVRVIKAVSSTVLFIGADQGKVYRTTNGGTSWNAVTGIPVGFDINTLDAWDSTHVAVVLYDGSPTAAYVSTNGTSFSVATLPNFGGCNELNWVSALVVAAACDAGNVAWSTDGGLTYSSVSSGLTEPLFDIHSASASAIWVVGTRGAMAYWNGTTWTKVDPAGARHNLLTMAGVGTTVYVGGNGQNVIGTNSGNPWTRQRIGTASMLDADSAGGTVLVAGDRGQLLRSTDRGVTFAAPVTVGAANAINGVDAIDATKAVAVGDKGTILSTVNGTTWTNVAPAGLATTNLLAVAAIDSRSWWVVGGSGTILRTDDAGANWTTLSSGTANLRAVTAPTQNVAWVAGDDTIKRTSNAGRTWTEQNPSSGAAWLSISAPDAATAYVVGGFSGLRKTTDSGGTWSPSVNPSGQYIEAVEAVDATHVWMADGAGINRTQDGATWTNEGNAYGDQWALAAVDANLAISGNMNGRVDARTSAASIANYGAGNNWSSGAGTGMFGMCLQALTGANADWTVDVTGTANFCEATGTDPWVPVPAAPSKVAHTLTAGGAGQADFVFALRPASNTPPGDYSAAVVFEALAPDA
ncbi:MAG: hypothetical protein JWM86_2673 [Thermoleophilia bacterium]|nr:hypothetical protein [Thermoleophilia bacterium]